MKLYKNDIICELDKQLNTDGETICIAPSEVEGSICLSSDLQSPTSTSLGGNTDLDLKCLKLLLKDLAMKLIEDTYEEYKQNSSNLH